MIKLTIRLLAFLMDLGELTDQVFEAKIVHVDV